MVHAAPEGTPKVVEYEFRYEVADEYIDGQLDEEGIEVPQSWTIQFSLQDLPNARERRRARWIHEQYHAVPGYPTLDNPTEEPVEFLDGAERWVGEMNELNAYETSMRQEVEQERQRQSEQFEAEKRQWILTQGSERLQLATARGYKVSGSYARERAAHEFPGFWVDTSRDSEWNERVDPTMEALRNEVRIAKRAQDIDSDLVTRIVWLTEPSKDLAHAIEAIEGYPGYFEDQEAIIVADYLGRYTLVLPIDSEYQLDLNLGEPS